MEKLILIINWIALATSSIVIAIVIISSIKEKEKRATLISIAACLINLGIWLFFLFFKNATWEFSLNVIVLLVLAVMIPLSLVKYFPKQPERNLSTVEPYDEREHMFSRNALQNQPQYADHYYHNHPEQKEIDKKIHSKPELGEPGSLYYDKDYSPVFDAAFHFLERTRSATIGDASPEKHKIEIKKTVQLIKEIGRSYGAVDVGFTTLKSYHIYTHAGRRAENWGKKITNTHKTAIAIIVAMEVEKIKQAPGIPVILESSRQYVEAAKIATIIAQYIRDLGYEARAHTDGNYEVLCVPVAIDAGLGELGRIGIFMHPIYGPCVRISVVTTQLELDISGDQSVSKRTEMVDSIAHFCDICKKCADNCPTQSICKESEPSSRGVRHWSIRQETCYSYWKSIGTDCGFCICVCPYTKPNTLMHKLVRYYISRNIINQRIALFLDDLFYGRKLKV